MSDLVRNPHTTSRMHLYQQENEMNDQTRTPITDVRTIGVPVTDQDRAIEFYLDRLGFEKRVDAPVPQFGGRWIEVAPPGATITIALVPTREGVPAGVGDRHQVHDRRRRRGPSRPPSPRRRGRRAVALAGSARDVRRA
jgi:catechol 2,3-dioxygenase-like lactoylglutathione lyase family enzyme